MKKETEIQIKADAKKIAGLIADTNTDYRGDLLFEVGCILRNYSQYCTGGLIIRLALEYGTNDNNNT